MNFGRIRLSEKRREGSVEWRTGTERDGAYLYYTYALEHVKICPSLAGDPSFVEISRPEPVYVSKLS